MPCLARDVGELTATNVLVGWAESVAIMAAGAVTRITLAWAGVEYVFVARMFGIAEGLSMAGLAVGSLLAPALMALGDAQLALAAVASILPVLVLSCVLLLVRVDQRAKVPIVEISLLRSLRILTARRCRRWRGWPTPWNGSSMTRAR